MKTYKIVISAVLTAIFSLTSCSYLDVVPPETVDVDDMMRDKDEALKFLYSCYSSIGRSNAPNNMAAIESSVDEFVSPLSWERMGQVVSWNQVSPTYVTNWWPQVLPWDLVYANIGQCHLFLKLLDELQPKGVTEEDKALWRSEIKFLLGYHHFRLLMLYGPIPIVDKLHPIDIAKEDMPGRSHFDYCVDRIVEWLDEAAEGLPSVWSQDLNLCRATSTICKALKARLLLYAASPLWNGGYPNPGWQNTSYETQGYGKALISNKYEESKWERAKTACQEALDYALNEGQRSLFSLELSETLRKNENLRLPDIGGRTENTAENEAFKKRVMMFKYLTSAAENEGNREVIWGVFTFGWTTTFNEVLPHAIVTKNDGTPYGGGSGASPLLFAVENFYTENGLPPKFDENFYPEAEWFTSAGLSGRPDVIKLNDNREPRFYAWIGFDGGELGQKMSNGNPCTLRMRDANSHGYNPQLFNRDNSPTGFVNTKWTSPGYSWYSTGSIIRRPVAPTIYIRLAELYLNLAECHEALGEVQEALDNLNVIRKRAGIRTLTEDDLTSEMTLKDWIVNERYIEFYGEGHRYYDLRRWLLADKYLKAGMRYGLNAIEKKNPTFEEFNKRTLVDQPFQWDNRMLFMPIAADEVYSNPQLVQAPGY